MLIYYRQQDYTSFWKETVLLKTDMPKGAEEFPVYQPKSTPQEL